MWGQDQLSYAYVPCLRIIPTRVGTSLTVAELFASYEDHPHACGDKPESALGCNYMVGSSPRVWGQGKLLKSLAYAIEDHPHACGDKKTTRPKEPKPRGSSPRVWGQGK